MSSLVEPGQPATDVEDPPEPPAETLEEEEKRFKKKTDQERDDIYDERLVKVSGLSGQRKDDDDAVCVWDLYYSLQRLPSECGLHHLPSAKTIDPHRPRRVRKPT